MSEPDALTAPQTTPLNAPRARPRADTFERGLWAVIMAGAILVLAMAAYLKPNYPHGVGTHEQLGLPPCGLVALYQLPCPSCGFTTCFSLGIRGRWIDSAVNQPFGFLLFLGAVLSIPLALRVTIYRYSVLAATQRWPWLRLLIGVFSMWLAAWGYKILTWNP